MCKIFYQFLLDNKIKFPVIVFIDGHKSPVSLNLSEFCSANQIELIALYPNSTHLTQPMDVGVFKSLNSSFVTKAKDWRTLKQYSKIERKDVAPILEDAIAAIKYSELLVKAFRRSGLFPFTVDHIEFSRILPTVGENVATPAMTRLQHFERLIGELVLNVFRLSPAVWTGQLEYSALFSIWKQMRVEASTTIAEVDSNSPLEYDGNFFFSKNQFVQLFF